MITKKIKIMLTLTQFESAITDLQLFFKEQEKLENVLKVLSPTSTGVCEFGNRFIEDYIHLLAKAVNDEGADWLFWYIFDNDFGKRNLLAITRDNQGNEQSCNIDSVKKLYEFVLNPE